MTTPVEASALKTWARVLGFLAALMLVLGAVAYLTGMVGASRKLPHSTEARH